MRNLDLQSSYKIYKLENDIKKSDTVVIDNGTYELKAGYLGDKIAIKFQNCFYKDSEGIKFQQGKNKNRYTPFTYDMISGFHVLEENLDQAFEFLDVRECKNLIITDAIYSPTKKDLLRFLFEVYHFKKIQIGVDGIYSYIKNCLGKINNDTSTCSVVISLGHTSTCIYLIKDKKIEDVYKIIYGGKFAHTYLNNLIRYKFKEHNKDYYNLIKELQCPLDYDKAVFEIVERMKIKDFGSSVCLSEPVEEKEVVVDVERRNRLIERLKNINKKRKKVESESEDVESRDNESEEAEDDESEKINDEDDDEKNK